MDPETACAGYPLGDSQHLYVVDSSGVLLPLLLGPPDWQWTWQAALTQQADIRALAAHFHAGDGHHHCFPSDGAGSVWEVSFASPLNPASAKKTWLANWSQGIQRIASLSGDDGSQYLFIMANDGMIYPLVLSATTGWVWSKLNAITTKSTTLLKTQLRKRVGKR